MKKMPRCLSPLILALLLLLVSPSLCWSWQGKVVGVSDGDTITAMHDGKGEKIRLYGVDCPEKDQDFGQKAKQFTSDRVFGKTVEVNPIDQDRYGRTVGIVTTQGTILNIDLLRPGHASGSIANIAPGLNAKNGNRSRPRLRETRSFYGLCPVRFRLGSSGTVGEVVNRVSSHRLSERISHKQG